MPEAQATDARAMADPSALIEGFGDPHKALHSLPRAPLRFPSEGVLIRAVSAAAALALSCAGVSGRDGEESHADGVVANVWPLAPRIKAALAQQA